MFAWPYDATLRRSFRFMVRVVEWRPCKLTLFSTDNITNLGSVVCSGRAGFRPRGTFLAVVPRRAQIAVSLIHRIAENSSATAVVASQAVPGDLCQAVRPTVPT